MVWAPATSRAVVSIGIEVPPTGVCSRVIESPSPKNIVSPSNNISMVPEITSMVALPQVSKAWSPAVNIIVRIPQALTSALPVAGIVTPLTGSSVIERFALPEIISPKVVPSLKLSLVGSFGSASILSSIPSPSVSTGVWRVSNAIASGTFRPVIKLASSRAPVLSYCRTVLRSRSAT